MWFATLFYQSFFCTSIFKYIPQLANEDFFKHNHHAITKFAKNWTIIS